MFEDKGEGRAFLRLAKHRHRAQQLIYVDQSAYAAKIVREAGMEDSVPKRIPLQPHKLT
jgi:hypothetical protein